MVDWKGNGKAAGGWLVRLTINTGVIAAAFTAVIVATGHLDKLRPWASADEIRTVAKRIYQLSIPEQRRVVTSIQRDLDNANDEPPAQRDVNDQLRIFRLETELINAEDTMKELLIERKRFRK